jgi:hypothetical protein
MIKIIIPLLSLLLAACATQNTTFTPVQPSSEKGAAVYVYRASHVSNIMLPPEIRIKDAAGKETVIGRLNYGEYKLVYLEPGLYQLQLDAINYYAPAADSTLEVKPLSVNYLRLDTSLKFETGTRYKSYEREYSFQQVEQTLAVGELSSCVDVDSKPKKKSRLANVEPEAVTKEATENSEEAVFSTDKTANPFSRP